MPTPLTLQVVLDLVGIGVAALSGVLTGIRHGLHLMGCMLLALVTGLGGGILRDVLLGDLPTPLLTDWRYPAVALGIGLLTQRFHSLLGRIEKVTDYADAVWLGLFSAGGALKAVNLGVPPLMGILMGVATGVGGGVLRDIVVNRRPVVLVDEIYVFPSVLTGVVIVGSPYLGWSAAGATLPAAAVGMLVRMLAIRRRWRGPSVSRRLTDGQGGSGS